MAARRVNPHRVKRHYNYTVHDLALALGVHRNTVRYWQSAGLEPIEAQRPFLFHGEAVRAFLTQRNMARKCPCPPGTIYCMRCRQPRAPALGMVDFVPVRPGSGNLRALCEECGSVMHRRVRYADIGVAMPGCAIQITQRQPSISGCVHPSLKCDLDKRG